MKHLLTAIITLGAAALAIGADFTTVGHRGSSVGVENTLTAFRTGAQRGYGFLETDIRVTADSVFVCSHDENTERLGGTLTIADATLEQLRSQPLRQTRFGTDYTGTITTLGEYLAVCDSAGIRPVIELKWSTGINSNDCSLMPLLIDSITAYGFRNKCVILTSMRPCLENIRANYPDIELQFLGGRTWKEHFHWADSLRLDMDIAHTYLDSADVAAIHAAGLKLNTWTIDAPGRADILRAWGADMITTNRLPARP